MSILPTKKIRHHPTEGRRSFLAHRSGGSLPVKRFPGRGWRPPSDWRRRFLFGAAAIAAIGAVFAVGVVAWVSRDLPDPNKLNSRSVAQSTKIYARDGSTLLYEIHDDQKRTLVRLEDVSPYIKQATLSIEDKDFYKHSGISLKGIVRSIFIDITHGSKLQGGSTITQQLVKNSILTREKSFTRKVKEIILSYQIERRFTKDQILKLYFNEIPYGSSAYGIEAAAQTYFAKHAKDLDLPESALLAAMVKAPTYYSPTGNHRDELVARQRLVLSEMVGQHYITKAQADAAKQVDILKRVSPYHDRVVAPHFVFYVRGLLVQKYGDVTVERGGLRVVTTLDPDLQKIAEEEVAKGVAKDETRYHATNAALVALDPKTGQLLAMVGSRDYFDTDYDGNFNVVTAVRNPGSSFKPFVYLTAFSKGYTPETILFDLKTDFGPDGSGKNFSPNNYDGKEHGPLQMRQALAGSLNIPAVKTLYLAGIPATLDTADKFGYTTIDRTKVGLALAIGGGGVKLLEHASAFATLINDGQRDPVTPILRIEDRNGKVLEQYQKKETRVFDQQPVRRVLSILTDNSARAFVFGSHSPLILSDRTVAAKTGTTNDFRDAWTLGGTPSLVAGVWRGNNDNSSMKGGADGVVVAAPIWNAFLKRALQGKPVDRFPKPDPNKSTKLVLQGKLQAEKTIFVDSVTGKLIPEACLAAWPKQYVKQQIVKEVHDILFYVNKDDPNGAAPADPTTDPMFARWEKPVQDWAKKNNYVSKAPPLEDCSLRTSTTGPSLGITSPTNNQTINSSSLPVVVDVSSTQGITSVQYSIDGAVLASVTTAPYGTTLDVSGVSNGFHTLRAVATDGLGGTSSDEVELNIVSNKNQGALYFLSPPNHATLASNSFPQTVKVFAYDPDGVSLITLYLVNPDGSNTVLDTDNSPSDSTVTLSWPTTPPGSYQLYFTVKDKKNKTVQSDKLSVTVS